MSDSIYTLVTGRILEGLRQGVVPWRKPWNDTLTLPINVVSQKAYRGINVFLLALMPHADHRWLTLKQANELGGRVRAGERSTTVVFWKTWRPEPDSEEPEVAKRRPVPLLRHFHVFNVEQVEGLSIPALPFKLQPPESERCECAEILIRGMPDLPSIQIGGTSAWYRPADDQVQIPKKDRFDSGDAYYATLFHELGHATGHTKRLNRAGVTDKIQFGSGEYSKEELVAELTSAFCCATVGLDNSLLADSASYIHGWLSILRADPKAVVIAAAQAQRAADFIRGITYAQP